MSCRCSFRDIQGSKRPNTINFLFQILFFFFEELKKKKNSNITGRTVSALLTEELLEKIMLAKTKHKKLCFFLNEIHSVV
jgi:predicted AAA+ superfamily ATPase